MSRAFEIIDNDIRRMRDLEKRIERQNIDALKQALEEIECLLDKSFQENSTRSDESRQFSKKH